jgi:hypothetical protein
MNFEKRYPLLSLWASLPWPLKLAVALMVSAGSCVAIWWFVQHGWPDWSPRNRSKLEVYLFMAAPWGILMAIIVFFYRDKFDDKER